MVLSWLSHRTMERKETKMPRHKKKLSSIAKIKDMLDKLILSFIDLEHELTAIYNDAEKYKEVKPTIDKFINVMNPTPDTQVLKTEADQRIQHIKKTTEINTDVKPEEAKPNEQSESGTELENKKPDNLGEKKKGKIQ